MPCDTVTTQTVALAKAIPSILAATLKSLGWIIDKKRTDQQISAYYMGTNISWTAGKGLAVRAANPQEIITQVTKEYSKQAVAWAAQRAGWTVQQTAEDKLTVTRR